MGGQCEADHLHSGNRVGLMVKIRSGLVTVPRQGGCGATPTRRAAPREDSSVELHRKAREPRAWNLQRSGLSRLWRVVPLTNRTEKGSSDKATGLVRKPAFLPAGIREVLTKC